MVHIISILPPVHIGKGDTLRIDPLIQSAITEFKTKNHSTGCLRFGRAGLIASRIAPV